MVKPETLITAGSLLVSVTVLSVALAGSTAMVTVADAPTVSVAPLPEGSVIAMLSTSTVLSFSPQEEENRATAKIAVKKLNLTNLDIITKIYKIKKLKKMDYCDFPVSVVG
jgi:hypothetical protein